MHLVSGCGGMSWNASLWFPASCATLLFSSMALVHGPLDGPSPRSRDWAAHARRCEKGASGRCCLPQFRSSVLVLCLFFRGCPRVWSCCSPLVAVSLLVVPSVVAHVHPWNVLLLVDMASTNDLIINRVGSLPRCETYLFSDHLVGFESQWAAMNCSSRTPTRSYNKKGQVSCMPDRPAEASAKCAGQKGALSYNYESGGFYRRAMGPGPLFPLGDRCVLDAWSLTNLALPSGECVTLAAVVPLQKKAACGCFRRPATQSTRACAARGWFLSSAQPRQSSWGRS
jgi:hypothetical protein